MPGMAHLTRAVESIVIERKRQRRLWGAAHDDGHDQDELVRAAAAYLDGEPTLWPWDDASYKPSPNNRIRELVKAGALIIAEIERLERLPVESRVV